MARPTTARLWWLAFLILVALLGNVGSAWAQVTGTKSVGPTGADYATLTAAMAAVNTNGISGSVILELQSGYVSTGETFPIEYKLVPAGGATVTVRPAAGATGRSITGSNGTAILNINGGKSLVLDGRAGGTGTTASLLVANTNASGTTIQFVNNANNNTVQYCQVQGITSSTTSGVVYFGTGTAGGGGNSTNSLLNNRISTSSGTLTPTFLIFSLGTATAGAANSGNIIDSNELFDYFLASANAAAIYLAGTNANGHTAWSITNNSIYQTTTRTSSAGNTYFGIFIGTGAGYTITGNAIGGAAAGAASGTFTVAGANANKFVGIQAAFSSGTASSLQGNTIRRIALNTTSGSGSSNGVFSGIYVSAGDTNIGNVTGNTIGDVSNANSIVVTSVTNGGALMAGINNLSTGTTNISNNTVANLKLTTAYTGGSAFSLLFYGIQASGGTTAGSPAVVVTGNTIKDNSVTATGSSTMPALTLYGYYNFGSPVAETVTNNTITGLTVSGTSAATTHTVRGISINTVVADAQIVTGNTIGGLAISSGSGTVTGLALLTGGATGTNIARNKIYDLSATGAAGFANGITISGGTTYPVNNNLIGDLRTPAASSTTAIAGLNITSTATGPTTTVNAYYNTIYLNATSSAATFGTSGIFANTTPTLDLRNNIVVNTSTAKGAGLTVAYRRSSTTLTSYASTSNNNLFWAGTPSAANLIFNDGTNSDQTLAVYKNRVTPRDAASVSENPPFLSTTGTDPTFLHINPSVVTQVESNGAPVSGITTDYDGDARDASTPDIGADEGSFMPNDLTPPTITYTALASTASTASRTLTATITDASGIATGTGAPLLYYRVGTTGAYTSVAASTASGSSYTFTIPGAAVGSTVQYYVAAQDASANSNASTSPAGGSGTNPPGSTAPGSPNSYLILPTLSGDYYVLGTAAAGTSPDPTKEFATLTAAAAAYNSSGLGGPVRFLLFSNTQGTETYPINFGANADASATNTLTIKPYTGVVTAFTNATTTSTFKTTSGSYIIFDGSNTAGGTTRNLTLSNTSATATAAALVWVAGTPAAPAVGVQVRNLNLQGAANSSGTSTGVLVCSTTYNLSTGGSANSIVINNNTVLGASQGIVVGLDATTPGTGLQITNNVVGPATAATATNISVFGIFVAQATSPAVTGNLVQNVVATSATAPVGMSFPAGVTGAAVSQNTITGITTTFASDTYGLLLGTGFTGGLVNRNKVLNVGPATTTNGYSGHGIDVGTGSTTANLTLRNNFVAGITGAGWTNLNSSSNAGITGIRIYNGGQGGINLYYNSVNLTGTAPQASAALMSAALYVGTGTTVLDIRNNIFVNSINSSAASGTPKAFAFYSTSANTAFAPIDYNDYFVSGTQGVLGNIGGTGTNTTSGTDLTTLAAFQATTGTGQDANSKNIDPGFLAATDLHTTNVALAAGTPIAGVTVDIDGETRSTTTPWMGADEVPAVALDAQPIALVAPAAGSTCYSAAQVVTVTVRNSSTTNVLDFTASPVTVTVSVSGAVTQTFTTTVSTNAGNPGGTPLASGASVNITLPGTLDMTLPGTYSFAVSATASGDQNTGNDNLAAQTRTVQPLAPGTASVTPATSCGPTTATLTATGATGGTLTWYSSADGYTAAIGTGSPFVTPSLTATTSFQAKSVCGPSSSAFSNTVTVTVTNPTITATNTPVSRCGAGSVTLTATASSGATAQYYTAATGGTAFATGPSATVSVTGTTTYYVGAKDNGSATNVAGLASNVGNGTSAGTTVADYALGFNVTTAGTLVSVDVYPTVAGTSSIQLYTVAGGNPGAGTAVSGAVVSRAFTAAEVGTKVTVPLGFALAAGGYKLSNPANAAGFVRYAAGNYTGSYPLTSGPISVTHSYSSAGTSSTSNTSYNNFFNLTFATSCEPTARTPIQVNVTTPPAVTPAAPASTVCANSSTTITFGGYPTYSVTPTATATVSGSDITFTPAATTTYTVTGTDGTCSNTTTVTLTVTPLAAGSASANPGSYCNSPGGSPTLTLTGTTGATSGFVWQSASSAGGPFADLAGSANQASFVAPAITATTYYQAVATCGSNTATSNLVTVAVSNPVVTTTNSPVTRCGPGTVTLTATPNAGSTIYWYDTNTSTTILATSNSYSPNVTASRQYFAAAGTPNAGSESVGRAAPTASAGTTTSNGLVFTAASAFILKSVNIYPNGAAGSVTIQVQNSAGTLIPGLTGTYSYPAGTGATAYTVNLNYNVPAGTGLRLVTSGTFTSLVRETSSGGFPYTSPSGNVSITAGTTATTYFYFYNWQVTGPCQSARMAVDVNVTTPPTLSYTGTPSYCAGGSTVLTFVPGTYTNLSILPATNATVSGSTITFSGAAVGTTAYTVSANDGNSTTGCSATLPVSITVNPTPNAPTLAPSTPAAYCAGGSTVVAASTNAVTLTGQTILSTADFDSGANGFTTTNTGLPITGFKRVAAPFTGTRAGNPTSYNGPSNSGTGSFFIADSDDGGIGSNTNTTLVSPAFSTLAYTAATLSVQQYYNSFSNDTFAGIEYSTDGTTWTAFATYTGSDVGTSSGASPATTVALPAAALNQASVQIRFRYAGVYGLYWAIDNVGVSGTRTDQPTYTVVGNPATASVAGSNITFNPTTTTTYNVTASYPSSGCTSPATPITITVNPLPTFSTTQTNVACFGGTGSITVTAAGGTAPYSYSIDNGTSYTASATNPYTFTGLAAGTYQVLVKGQFCTASAAQSVTITAPASATAVTATKTDETAAGANDGTVTATGNGGTSPYQYSLDGTTFLPAVATAGAYTFTGVLAGSYTVTVRDANACTANTTVSVGTAAACTTTTYTGAASGDGSNWFNPANWTACVPSRTVDALIPAGLANYPNLSTTAAAEVRSLTLDNGTRLAQSAGLLSVYGNLTNNTPAANATLTGGAVAFVGSVAQNLDGSQPLSFFQLTVNKADTLHVNTNQTVANALVLTSGILKTYVLANSHKISLTGSATITETSTSFVLGDVEVPAADLSTDNSTSSFAGLGLTLTTHALKADNVTPATLPGLTTVMRSTGTPLYGVTPAGGPRSRSIRRRFTITPVNDTNLNVDMVFGYNNSVFELNSISESNLRLFSAPTVAGPFAYAGGTPNTSAHTVSKAGLDHLSVWTLGDAQAPLPVELSSFTAERQGTNAALAWTTASEKNNRGFEVQVSTDGRSFREMGFVAGAGSSTAPRAYAFLDQEASKAGLRYYRLRQLDLDGTATFSPVRTVTFGTSEATALRLTAAPNPFRQSLTLTVDVPLGTAAAPAQLTLTDAAGRTLLKQGTATLQAGTNKVELPEELASLASGVYFVHLALPGQPAQHLKVVKE
ncbi:hypothetical protein GCM10028824_27180 [Hymenobacter segetis]